MGLCDASGVSLAFYAVSEGFRGYLKISGSFQRLNRFSKESQEISEGLRSIKGGPGGFRWVPGAFQGVSGAL